MFDSDIASALYTAGWDGDLVSVDESLLSLSHCGRLGWDADILLLGLLPLSRSETLLA